MILLDPDLEPDPTPKVTAAKRAGASKAKPTSGPKAASAPADIRLPSARTLARFLAAAQQAVRLKGQVTVLLTTDAAIRKLNKQFRGKNTATDVLSFPADPMPGLKAAEQVAGDLAISVTTALKQARQQGHALATEIKVLVLHGLLHLAGYDHEADQGQMARRERLLRNRLKLPQGLIERVAEPKAHALKGHGLSRGEDSRGGNSALAAEGIEVARKESPPERKLKALSEARSERLKPRPSKTADRTSNVAKAKRP